MLRFPLLWLLSASLAYSALAHLPNTGINAIKVDSAGNIYVAGYQGTAGAMATYDAFVAKLSPGGSRVLFSTKLGGSRYDEALALDLDSTGAAHVFGRTQSSDFPATPGALQTTLASGLIQGFVAKLDAQGNVIYATLIGGNSNIFATPASLVVDGAGEAIVSASTDGETFPTPTSGLSTGTTPNFVLKLDSTGSKLLGAVRGIGGLLALDSQGNVYIAGSEAGETIPVTPGAFQPSAPFLILCGGSGRFPGVCSNQYVTKLDATLNQTIFSTYLTGTFGATPAAISVDAQGNILLAGVTNSPDYPTTSASFEPNYIANAPPGFGADFPPPPASGYVTTLNATGSALLASTFFSGTQSDTIDFAASTAGGIYVSGHANSPDLPGLEGVPEPCMPQNFETRISLDGSSITATHTVPGNVLAYDSLTGTLPAWTGVDLIGFDPAAPPNHIACILDAADRMPVASVAPGELLSIFGSHFVFDETSTAQPGPVPTSIAGIGLTATVNGIGAPLMYVSPEQINLQAPFEIAGTQANVVLTSTDLNYSESNVFPAVARNPVVFLDTATSPTSIDLSDCPSGLSYSGGLLPVAFNSDGSQNACSNPATAGSVVRIFLAGLGVTAPLPMTGSINPSPGVPLNLPITFGGSLGATIVSAVAAPGSISGVWQVDIRMPSNVHGAVPVSLSVDSVPVRDLNFTIWVD